MSSFYGTDRQNLRLQADPPGSTRPLIQATARLNQAKIHAAPPQGTAARQASKPSTCRAYRLKLNNSKPTSISPPAAKLQRDTPHTPMAKPVISKPTEWNCCWLKAVCTAVGTPAAKTGKWANAALNTTLVQALSAPKAPKMRADTGKENIGEVVMSGWALRQKKGQGALEHGACPDFDFRQRFFGAFAAQ